LLGGLSATQFMRRHWQKKPLLVRGAIADVAAPVTRAQMFALAARDDVESRLIQRDARDRWQLRQGPLARRAMPPLARPGWTLLVQGLDLHNDAAHELLSHFRFVPTVRLDDLMLSYASAGGGVGPHTDSYDVFLLQVQGRRRWGIGRVKDPQLREDVPLKMLARFEPERQWLLEPGDLLYLPRMGRRRCRGRRCMAARRFRPPQSTIGTGLFTRPAGRSRALCYRDAAQWRHGGGAVPSLCGARRAVARCSSTDARAHAR
jgi:50S ribosomal protein L16 3-hydroxylase